MIKEQIQNYFQSQKAQFKLNFEPAYATVNVDVIHDLRVSVKRLRLVYRLLNFFADKQFCAKKRAKLLIEVFKSAAALRDVQIGLAIIEKNNQDVQSDDDLMIKFLKEKELVEIHKFKEKYKKFELEEIDKLFVFSETLLNIIVDFPGLQQTFNIYKELSLQEIIDLLKKDKVDFHSVRKKLKNLTYLTEIEQIHLLETTEKLFLLKFLGKLLGDWHDLDVFLNELDLMQNEKKISEINHRKMIKNLKEQQRFIVEEFYQKFEELE